MLDVVQDVDNDETMPCTPVKPS
jgi:hypothetical protein